MTAENRLNALLQVPQGSFELVRQPRDNKLRAWDAADEYLLQHLYESGVISPQLRILILNDAFGALGVALADYSPASWSDSFLAQQALHTNLALNGYPEGQVSINHDIDMGAGPVDLALIKIPKTLALLEHQLYQLRKALHAGSQIVAAGMARYVHRSTLARFEAILGPTSTTFARKKSRLILVQRDHSLNQGQSPYPDCYELEVNRVFSLINHAALFSRDRLDAGTRLLLEHLPIDSSIRDIIDLGCGNGVLGMIAAELNPDSRLLFCDESYMAIASARQNFQTAFGDAREAQFQVGDGLEGVGSESSDLILINPPFHQQHQMGDTVAWRMFQQSHRVLRKGGELRIVGNRHLGYHAKLKKLFGRCTLIASNHKFVILSARKT